MQPMLKRKIAIIEDDVSIQQMYVFKLGSCGYDVRAASDGHEGLTLVESFKPELLLLDLKMPHMNGDEMLQLLRETEHGMHVKVIILTNLSRDEAPRSLQLLHVNRYVVKAHHTPSQVTDIVAEVLGRN
jgi:chemosensory pili system protein ChpA (sensor histidine kinase/response regulator)